LREAVRHNSPQFAPREIEDLVAFLESLNDE
jgi:hypothetical protein